MGPGRAYIDCSTVDPDTATEISAAVTARGGRFLEAPVSGSRKPAEDGTLVVLTAGEESLYREALPYLEVLGKKAFYLGAVGRGATLKLIVNLVMGEMMAALCEGISLAERAHIPTDVLLDVLDAGAVANPMFRLKGPAIHQREFAVNFPLKHMQKDLRLALELGDRLALALPAGAAVNELFKRARDLGLGDLDFAALFRACAGE
jgi:2-hydroxy-3-oxopropionate reductase